MGDEDMASGSGAAATSPVGDAAATATASVDGAAAAGAGGVEAAGGVRAAKYPPCAEGMGMEGMKVLFDDELLDSQCAATPKMTQGVKDMVQYAGNGNYPKWHVRKDCLDAKGNMWWKKGAGRIKQCANDMYPAKIDCPCAGTNGKKISANTAFERILGQLAGLDFDMGVVPDQKNEVKTKAYRQDVARRVQFERMKSGLASVSMFQCWRRRCAVKSTAQANDLQTLLSANLELESRSELGDGSRTGSKSGSSSGFDLLQKADTSVWESDAELGDAITGKTEVQAPSWGYTCSKW